MFRESTQAKSLAPRVIESTFVIHQATEKFDPTNYTGPIAIDHGGCLLIGTGNTITVNHLSHVVRAISTWGGLEDEQQ